MEMLEIDGSSEQQFRISALEVMLEGHGLSVATMATNLALGVNVVTPSPRASQSGEPRPDGPAAGAAPQRRAQVFDMSTPPDIDERLRQLEAERAADKLITNQPRRASSVGKAD